MREKSGEKKRNNVLGIVVLLLLIFGVFFWQKSIPRPLPEYVDPIESIKVEDEQPPLSQAPLVTTTEKSNKKTTVKYVKMKKAASKTYTKSLPVKIKKSTKTTAASTKTTKVTTLTKTAIKEKYTKKSYKKKVTTIVTTTITTTITKKKTVSSTTAAKASYEITPAKAAPKMKTEVLKAFSQLGFKITINPSASYAGYFSAKDRSIILREEGETVYHELGHFVAFAAGGVDTGNSFENIYEKEKNLYSGYNKPYVTQNSSEYFAESVKNYILNPSKLKKERPSTYMAIEKAFACITEAQVKKLQLIYNSIWKNS